MSAKPKPKKLAGVKLDSDDFDWNAGFDEDDSGDEVAVDGNGEIDIQATMEEILNGKQPNGIKAKGNDKGKEKDNDKPTSPRYEQEKDKGKEKEVQSEPKKPASKFFRISKNSEVDDEVSAAF